MANLYNKAGLINIPVGYSDGFLYNIKPTDNTLAFRFDRASSATRVNEKGLIEQVGYFGPELIQNGNFDTDSDWNKDTGWGISGGKASCDGSQTGTSNLSQTNVITDTSKTYRVEFTLSNYTAGNVKAKISNDAQGVTKSANGTYVEFLSGMSNRTLSLTANADFIGSIDNVSVTEVLGDKPRIDYTDSLTSPSLLLEPQSTNLATYSEDFSQWTLGLNTEFVSSNNLSPTGALDANKYKSITTISNTFVMRNIGVSDNTAYTWSVYLRADNPSSITNGTLCRLNMTNGGQTASINVSELTTKWKRLSVTATSGVSSTAQCFLATDWNVDAEIEFWGAQLEEGSYPTSYIPTGGSTATRVAETCNGAGNASTFNDSEGVLYAEIASLNGDEAVGQMSVSNGSDNETVKILWLSANQIRLETKTASGTNFVKDVTVTRNGDFDKLAIKYKSNDYKVYFNGISQTVSQVANTPSGLIKLNFDRGDGASVFYGKIKSLAVFKEALTDAELQQLTS